jgi:hypothetical protein
MFVETEVIQSIVNYDDEQCYAVFRFEMYNLANVGVVVIQLLSLPRNGETVQPKISSKRRVFGGIF